MRLSLRKQGEDRLGVGGHGKSARGIHVVRKGIHLSKNGGVHHLVGMIVAMLLRLEEGGVHGRLKGLVEGLVRVLVVELLGFEHVAKRIGRLRSRNGRERNGEAVVGLGAVLKPTE